MLYSVSAQPCFPTDRQRTVCSDMARKRTLSEIPQVGNNRDTSPLCFGQWMPKAKRRKFVLNTVQLVWNDRPRIKQKRLEVNPTVVKTTPLSALIQMPIKHNLLEPTSLLPPTTTPPLFTMSEENFFEVSDKDNLHRRLVSHKTSAAGLGAALTDFGPPSMVLTNRRGDTVQRIRESLWDVCSSQDSRRNAGRTRQPPSCRKQLE